MVNADEDNTGELSVNLEWPADPLAPNVAAPDPLDVVTPSDGVDERLDAVDAWITEKAEEAQVTIGQLSSRLDHVSRELIAAVRAMHDVVEAQAKANRAALDKAVAKMSKSVERSVERTEQSADKLEGEVRAALDTIAAGVATELAAVRRRMQLQSSPKPTATAERIALKPAPEEPLVKKATTKKATTKKATAEKRPSKNAGARQRPLKAT
jgi:hypothetical protein